MIAFHCRKGAGDVGHGAITGNVPSRQVKDGLEEAELAATWNQRKRKRRMYPAAPEIPKFERACFRCRD